jgi:hypothetical protein
MAKTIGKTKTLEQLPVASPFSTGGGGSTFEFKVDAGLLATLLVRAHVPGFEGAVAHELHLQTQNQGYQTDDSMLVAVDSKGETHRQLWSVKHEVKYTESDPVFREVLKDAWADFSASDRFCVEADAIVLATSPVAATHKSLIALLEFARASASVTDFESALGSKGFVSQKSKGYLDLITELSKELTERDLSVEEIWRFLTRFHILGFDFDQTASQDEARFKTMLGVSLQAGVGMTGEELWNKLFKWAAERNPRGGSFTRSALPNNWRTQTTAITSQFESGVIHRLAEHSSLLLKRVKCTLGPKFELPRQEILDELSASFVEQPLTLVSGAAGVGKSATALRALRRILNGAPLFVFQAAEFARDHLDQALAEMRITEPVSRISSLFALHPRKFILLESVERLLESTEREAFFMLLSKLCEDQSWRIVLTCRQHAVALFQDAFLAPLNQGCMTINVPPLELKELDWVLEQMPALKRIAANDRTRELLRNPWFLDKACSVDWNNEPAAEPLDQRRLRGILWKQVVVRESDRKDGIHLHRDLVFQNIAVRRARSMKSFVPIVLGEEAAVHAMVADEILVQDSATQFVAPSHDVIEDWALVRWVSLLFTSSGHDVQRFFSELGHELAIRRCYRQWLQEVLACGELASVRPFIESVLESASVPTYWKEETVVSLLSSNDGPQFIDQWEAKLLANDKLQLKTVMHLLRVACKRPNPLWDLPEMVMGRVFGDSHLVPEGVSWGAIIRLIHRNIIKFTESDLPLLMGLLEDWKSGVNWRQPLPDAAREAALIALHFWKSLTDDYQWREELEILAGILLAAPSSIPNELEALMADEPQETSRRDFRNEILKKKLLASIECGATCKSHPAAVSAFAEREWHIDRPLPERLGYALGGRSDMEADFGLPIAFELKLFPASAYQGPFWSLLQNHPRTGLDLILKLSNVATERFVSNGLDEKYGQGPIEIEVPIDDAVVCRQWVNPRLWLQYCGAMPGSDVLQSALMALEKWLLTLGNSGHDLRHITKELLQRSNNAAITAVVASVAIAHPERVGETALALLRVPLFYDLDLQRQVHEPRTALPGDWGLNATDKLYHNERAESGKSAHRRETLETLACKLQTGTLREKVWRLIDDFKGELPVPEEQTDEDKLWRLKLHRMDLRNFERKEVSSDGRPIYAAKAPEADVAKVIESSAPKLQAVGEATSIVVWGMAVFENREPDKFDPKRWREMLEMGRRIELKQRSQSDEEVLPYEGGPGYVAAVCVRDHWKELSLEERNWCREYLLSKAEEHKDTSNEFFRLQRFSMSSQVAAARVLPLLLDDADERQTVRVREAIAAAITHSVDEVRNHASVAIGWYLWDRDAALAGACVAGLAKFAQLERCSYGKWRWLPWDTRGKLHDLVWGRIAALRQSIVMGTPLPEKSPYRLGISESFSARVLPFIANIIWHQLHRPEAQRIHLHIAKSFVRSWRADRFRRRSNAERRNYEAEAALRKQFAHFTVRCEPKIALELWEPIALAVDRHAEEVTKLFKQLVIAEDSGHFGRGFWPVWKRTKQAIVSISQWQDRTARDRSNLGQLASALLLDGIPWKEDARDWKPAHGYEKEITDFVQLAGAAPPVCKSFINLLDGIGAFLLPDALLLLDQTLRTGNPLQTVRSRNTLFSLARVLTPLVFSRTCVVRTNSGLQAATLRILNVMVEHGSSAAFRMRDFLITPTAPI